MSILESYSILETIIVTPSWPSRPRIQDISTGHLHCFAKRLMAKMESTFLPLSAFFRLSAFSVDQHFKIHCSNVVLNLRENFSNLLKTFL